MLVSPSGKQRAIFDRGTTPVFDDKSLLQYCLKPSGAETVPDFSTSALDIWVTVSYRE